MSDYKVKNPREDLSFEIAFTKAHRDAVKKYNRIEQIETACLRAQFPAVLHPIEEEDVLAGRMEMGLIGMGIKHTPGGYGYYCNFTKVAELLEKQAGNAKYREDLHDLLTYWKGRTSTEIVLREMPEHIRPALTSDNWKELPLPAHPIIRLSGTYLDYDKLMHLGLTGLKKEVDGYRQKAAECDDDTLMFECMLEDLQLIGETCLMYSRQAKELAQSSESEQRRLKLLKLSDALQKITERAPKSLLEAAQLAWIYGLFVPVTEFGRMDEYLGDFYVKDIDGGVITEEFALEIIQTFFRLIDSLNIKTAGRVYIGGYGRRNPENADRFGLVAIEACRTVREILPQFTLRFNKNTPENIWKASLNCIEEGRTYPILYNDDVLVPGVMKAFNVDRKLAERYMPLGCGEIEFDHYSYGTPSGSLNPLKILELTIRGGYEQMTHMRCGFDLPLKSLAECQSFEEFFGEYKKLLAFYIKSQSVFEKFLYDITAKKIRPYLIQTMLYDGCLERGKAVFDGGCYHYGGTLECYGNVNAANSLAAIKKTVFDEKSLLAEEIVEAMNDNYYGHEKIRKMLMDCPKYGNDDDYVDSLFVELQNYISETIREQAPHVGLDSYLGVTINNDQNTTLGRWVGATPDGRKAGTPMANANNPVPGTDKNGLTAMLNSILKPPHDNHAGMVQNIRFSKETLSENSDKIHGLIDHYFESGGAQLMITVVGREDLKNAIENPQDYKDLIVRLGGLSARFVELNKDIQQEIYDRSTY